MTKVDAIKKVMEDNGGAASLEIIYENIEKYYPDAKKSKDWDAGLRGVLYREIKSEKTFKKIGLSIYALKEYSEQEKPKSNDTVRMHSFIEGVCVELGNFSKYQTFTANPSAIYRDNLNLDAFASLKKVPNFSYDEVVQEVRRIDVVWFNSDGLLFPQKVFEVVDSIGTMNGAFNRSLQLKNFRTEFFIVAPEKHHEKFNATRDLVAYQDYKDRFTFINYEDIIELYENTAKANKLENKIFG